MIPKIGMMVKVKFAITDSALIGKTLPIAQMIRTSTGNYMVWLRDVEGTLSKGSWCIHANGKCQDLELTDTDEDGI